MSGRFLLDTNIAIALLEKELLVTSAVRSADEVFLAAIALGELHFGAQKSQRVEQNLARIDRLVSEIPTLGCDSDTARFYGRIRNHLRSQGRPIPDNDIWIAATAIQHQLTLVSRDAHFGHIADLAVVSWN